MAWWFWIALGAVLLVAEVIIAADFYLVFFGLAALLVGGMGLVGVALPAWAQWLLFALLAVAGLSVYRRRWKSRLSQVDRELTPDLEGEAGFARDGIAVGARGRVVLRGTEWDAVNGGGDDLPAGGRCVVTRVDGLTLHVRSES
ncbi:MAG: NfeD family protein [bacterium]|nr:NfeD family protein [bacterium]